MRSSFVEASTIQCSGDNSTAPDVKQHAGQPEKSSINEFRSADPLAKFFGDCKKRQGTTLVVPQVQQEEFGL